MKFKIFLANFFVFCFTSPLYAQVPSSTSLSDLSLEELMDLPITVASKSEQTQSRAPSIVSVISRREIERYGARDLSDVLRMVPGFEFGLDFGSSVGLGFRGIWAREGKILLLLNNVPISDISYGATEMFGTFPASLIERLEIIRGPGSALYGGFAESGVIHIITRTGKEVSGVALTGSGGWMGDQSVRYGDASFGTQTADMDLYGQIVTSGSVLSNRNFLDYQGTQIDLGNGNSDRRFSLILTRLKYKNSLTLQYSRMTTSMVGADGPAVVIPNKGAPDIYADAKDTFSAQYDWKLSENLTLTPRFDYTVGIPLQTSMDPSVYGGGDNNPYNQVWRHMGELLLQYRKPEVGEALLGVAATLDEIKALSTAGDPRVALSGQPMAFRTFSRAYAVYGQWMKEFGSIALTTGMRYENTTFGNAIAPRAGLTYVQGAFNSKLLYGRSFRIPAAFQAYWSPLLNVSTLRPEIADSLELELGYKFNKQAQLKINPYFIQVREPITFVTQTYINEGLIQSYGAEASLVYDTETHGGFLNFSYQKPSHKTSARYVTADRSDFLGLPPVKLNLGAHYKLGDFQFGPSVTYLSRRYGQSDAAGVAALTGTTLIESVEYKPLLLFNLAVNWQASKKMLVSLTSHNLFGADYVLLQTYYGGHAPLPAQDRDVRLEMRVSL